MMASYSNSGHKRPAPSPAQFCMVCLNVKCKLYPVNKCNLDLEFEKLTGISLQGMMLFEPQFCAECAQRLSNCSKFREKSHRAYHLLIGLVDNHGTLTTQNIMTVDRKTNKLASNIEKKKFRPDHCDLHLKELEDNYDTVKNYVEVKKEKNTFEDSDPVLDVKYEIELLNVETTKENTHQFNNESQNTVNLFKNDADGLDYDIDMDECDDTDYINDDNLSTLANERKNIKKEEKISNKQTINVNIRNKTNLNEVKQRKKVKQIKLEKHIKKNSTNKIHTSDSIVKKNVRKKAVHLTYLKQGQRKVNLKMFQEIELTQEQQMAEILNRKQSHNYKNAPHKCSVCYKGFQHLEAYESHMDRHTDKFGRLECDICRIRFKNKFALRKHVSIHQFIYKCTKCQFETNHRTAVEHHTRWHEGKTYACMQCGEEFTKCTSYMSHLRLKHPSDYVCTHCGLSFIGQRGLRMHMAKKHNLDDGPQNLSGPSCETCKIRFASLAAYKQHIKTSTKHAPTDQLKPNCPIQKKVPRKTVMSTCELCGMQVKSAHQYNVHFKTQHPGQKPAQFLQTPEMCEKCGKIFKWPVLLRQHMQMHTKTVFKCDMCGKSFMTKGSLKYHIDRHSDNLACSVCHKPSSNPANLARHMMSHLPEKPSFECEYCGKSYTSSRGRDQHVTHVHNHVPWPKKINGKRRGVNARRLSIHSD